MHWPWLLVWLVDFCLGKQNPFCGNSQWHSDLASNRFGKYASLTSLKKQTEIVGVVEAVMQ
jgi:hypothetical protein